MKNSIELFKTNLDNERQKTVKPVYDLLNNPMFTKKFKRELMGVIIEDTSGFLEEIKVLRDSI